MDIKNDMVTAYCAGYEAAQYDLDRYLLLENKKEILSDAKKWLEMMLKTGAIKLEG